MSIVKSKMLRKCACLPVRRTRQGFSLIEVLFTLMILSVGISSVAVLMTANIKNAITAKNQVIASALAQEGVELVRNWKDNNTSLPLMTPTVGDYIVDSVTSGFSNISLSGKLYLNSGYYTHASAGTPTKFFRKINVVHMVTNKEVTSFVSWDGADTSWNGNGTPTSCNIASQCVSIVSVLP